MPKSSISELESVLELEVLEGLDSED